MTLLKSLTVWMATNCGKFFKKSEVDQLCLTLCTLWTVSCKTPLSMEFSRSEYWKGLLPPFPGHLPDQGIKPGSPTLQADFLPSEPLEGNSSRDRNATPSYLLPEKSVCSQEMFRNGHGTLDWFKYEKGVLRLYIVTLYI